MRLANPVPLVSLWADVQGNQYVVCQGEHVYWTGNPPSHVGWLRPMIQAMMELEEKLEKEIEHGLR
tara:strand:- start:23940 stop:24137 length:198 start_codon:yes stop_codon:yes gene_type:complete